MTEFSTLEELAADGSPPSLMLMRVMVTKSPDLASQAFNLISDLETVSAANTVLGIMKDHPDSAALDGITALGKINSYKSLDNIFNFITSEEIPPENRMAAINHAFDILRESDHSHAVHVEKKLLEINPLVSALRISALEEEATEGDIFAIDEIERIGLISDGNGSQVLEALNAIGSDYAIEAYKRALEQIQNTEGLDSLGALLQKHGIVFPDHDDMGLNL